MIPELNNTVLHVMLDDIYIKHFQDIGHKGEMKWPARSPNLVPNDLFYWGFLQSKVFDGTALNMEQLKHCIRTVSDQIMPLQLQNTLNNLYHRLGYCLAVNEEVFENLL
ncbi:hypothetical protein ILUMI_02487 [Ignelater luminosus]|uniref:Uncharacterized protein n=1 Tax=Ignelater luminosus TaxID=2038154 RepID=A0A8K0DHJ7_IGNLU|nr:hypothetical protein ILUMI_02487 [Ignelater luminosus]